MENEYDKQIAYLKENPKHILSQWCSSIGIFKTLGYPSGQGETHVLSNCPVGIRLNSTHGVMINGVMDEKLTAELRVDSRIPLIPEEITVDHLPAFKEWQERVDKIVKEGYHDTTLPQ